MSPDQHAENLHEVDDGRSVWEGMRRWRGDDRVEQRGQHRDGRDDGRSDSAVEAKGKGDREGAVIERRRDPSPLTHFHLGLRRDLWCGVVPVDSDGAHRLLGFLLRTRVEV